MTKLKAFGNWLLHRKTDTVMLFMLLVWMPASLLLLATIIMPHIAKQDWSVLEKSVVSLIIFVYLFFAPLFFELVKDYINTNRSKP